MKPLDIKDPVSAYFTLSDEVQEKLIGNGKNKIMMDSKIKSQATNNEQKTTCPKCGHLNTESESCIRCGIFFSKYYEIQQRKKIKILGEKIKKPEEYKAKKIDEKKQPKYNLRNKSIMVFNSDTELIKKAFRVKQIDNDDLINLLSYNLVPIENIDNEFDIILDNTIIDYSTGLMWQQSGLAECRSLDEAEDYINKLNKDRFVGYNDWRLPTVDELLSLFEPDIIKTKRPEHEFKELCEIWLIEKGEDTQIEESVIELFKYFHLHISSLFDPHHYKFWSADKRNKRWGECGGWSVSFRPDEPGINDYGRSVKALRTFCKYEPEAIIEVPHINYKMVYINADVPIENTRVSKALNPNIDIIKSEELIEGFYIGVTVVTQGQWYQIMKTKPWDGHDYVGKGNGYPAVFISWNDVMEFIEKLNSLEKTTQYDLPTEVEWEYACQAGSQADYNFGESKEILKNHAWFLNNTVETAEEFVHPVAKKLPNEWGLYDMHGNVREFCFRNYEEIEQGTMDYITYKGGAWNDPPELCKSANKFGTISRNRKGNSIGFRLVKTFNSYK